MSSGRRPGGLTALAIVNFVFAGLAFLGLLGLVFVFSLLGMAMEEVPESQQAVIEALHEVGMLWWILSMLANLISAILLLVSGIGYLKLKPFMGRTLGNVYAIFTLIVTVLVALTLPTVLGGGFGIGTLISIIYPVLTLILLNATFKEDFVR